MKTFELTGDFIELNKLLKAGGLCGSGGEANAAVTEGRVKVNGEKELRKRRKTRKGDVVVFGGKSIAVS